MKTVCLQIVYFSLVAILFLGCNRHKEHVLPRDPDAKVDFSWSPAEPTLFDTVTLVSTSANVSGLMWSYMLSEPFIDSALVQKIRFPAKNYTSISLAGKDKYGNSLHTVKTIPVKTGWTKSGIFNFGRSRRHYTGATQTSYQVLPDTVLTLSVLNDSTVKINDYVLVNSFDNSNFDDGIFFVSVPMTNNNYFLLKYYIRTDRIHLIRGEQVNGEFIETTFYQKP